MIPRLAFHNHYIMPDKYTIIFKEEFYKLKYCSTVVYMVPRA